MSEAAQSTFVYVTYIRTSPEKLWSALFQPQSTRQYWYGVEMVCDWKVGASWQLRFPDGRIGDTGEVLETGEPMTRERL